MKNIRVAYFSGCDLIYLPFFVAIHRQYFEERGYRVLAYPVNNDDQVCRELQLGKADFGIADPSFVATSKDQDEPIKVISALVTNVPVWGYTNHPEISLIKKWQDLASLRLAVYPKPSTTYALIKNLELQQNTQIKSIEILETKLGEANSQLASGKVDLAIEVEPMVSLSEELGSKVVFALSDFYQDLLFTSVMTRLKTIKNNPDIVSLFVGCLQKGLNFCQNDVAELLPIAKVCFPALSEQCLINSINRLKSAKVWPRQLVPHISHWHTILSIRSRLASVQLNNIEGYLDPSFAYNAFAKVI